MARAIVPFGPPARWGRGGNGAPMSAIGEALWGFTAFGVAVLIEADSNTNLPLQKPAFFYLLVMFVLLGIACFRDTAAYNATRDPYERDDYSYGMFFFLIVWSVFVFVWGILAIHAGVMNKGAISRNQTPITFWLVVSGAFGASIGTLIYDIHRLRRYLRRKR
jgi:hypothetical protein